KRGFGMKFIMAWLPFIPLVGRCMRRMLRCLALLHPSATWMKGLVYGKRYLQKKFVRLVLNLTIIPCISRILVLTIQLIDVLAWALRFRFPILNMDNIETKEFIPHRDLCFPYYNLTRQLDVQRYLLKRILGFCRSLN